MDQDEISNLYRGPSIDASYQVSVHLAEGFHRRLKYEKLTDDGRWTPSDGKSSHRLWQGELKRKKKEIKKKKKKEKKERKKERKKKNILSPNISFKIPTVHSPFEFHIFYSYIYIYIY